jgi:hypothetical protein
MPRTNLNLNNVSHDFESLVRLLFKDPSQPTFPERRSQFRAISCAGPTGIRASERIALPSNPFFLLKLATASAIFHCGVVYVCINPAPVRQLLSTGLLVAQRPPVRRKPVAFEETCRLRRISMVYQQPSSHPSAPMH